MYFRICKCECNDQFTEHPMVRVQWLFYLPNIQCCALTMFYKKAYVFNYVLVVLG